MQISPSSTAPAPAFVPARPSGASAPSAPASGFAEVLASASQKTAEAAPSASKPASLPPLFKYAADGVITGDEMRLELADARADYMRRLTAAFAAHGLEPSQPLRLTTDTAGMVRVIGEHPEKARVEQVFAEDPQLANAFRRVTSLASLLSRAEESIAFQQAYAQDPVAAVARYAHLFNTDLRVTMTHRWGEEGLELLFESENVIRSAWG